MSVAPGSAEGHGQQPGWPGQQPAGPTPPGGYPPPLPGWGPGAPGGPPVGYPPHTGYIPPVAGAPPKGFFAGLFDVGFTTFVTGAAVKFLYVVGMVVLALVYVAAVIGAFRTGPLVLGVITLVIGAFLALVILTIIRVVLEHAYAMIRMSEDIHHRRGAAT